MRRSVIRLVESARNRLQYALATEDPGEWYTGGRYSDRMDEQLLLNVYTVSYTHLTLPTIYSV